MAAAVELIDGFRYEIAGSMQHRPRVYAFTTVATQAVVQPERAGEAAGVTLTSLVTLGGVGVAVTGTVLALLHGNGLSQGCAE